jgi:hypothetical protein
LNAKRSTGSQVEFFERCGLNAKRSTGSQVEFLEKVPTTFLERLW